MCARRPPVSDLAPVVKAWLLRAASAAGRLALRTLRAGRDLVLLVGDYAPRAVPPARKAALRFRAASAAAASWARDRAARDLPRAGKLALRFLAAMRDLALLARDYVVRAVPPAKRLVLRAAPPARRTALKVRRNLVFPARNLMILGALALLGLGVAQTGPGHTVLADAGLYQRPAGYTELTFTSPGTLPSSLAKAKSSIDVSFDIHNVSGAARSYQWSVVLAGGGQSRVSAAGTAAVPDQGRVTVTRPVAATCSGTRLQVLVRLASPAESIHFWVTCPAVARGAK